MCENSRFRSLSLSPASPSPATPQLTRVGTSAVPRKEASAAEALLFGWLQSLLLALWADPGWMGGRVRGEVAALLDVPAGPELISALAALPGGDCQADHTGEDDGWLQGLPAFGSAGAPCLCLLVVAAAWQACAGYVAASARVAVVEAVGRDPVVVPAQDHSPRIGDPAREELAGALRLSPGSAATRIDGSRRLAGLPELAALLAQGLVSEAAAVGIALRLDRLDPGDARACATELALRIRRRVARGMRPWTASDAADCARRLASKCRSHAELRKRAVAQRRVGKWDNGDGTATVQAVLSDVVAERVHRRLTALAHGLGDDPRPLDARRADLLADLVLGAPAGGPTGVEINVVIDAATLLGLAQEHAEVPGMGPLPADLARELAADSRWRAWIRDASGAVVATGSAGYRPTEAVARVVRAREKFCRMPGCRSRAADCDLDHAVAWPQGATTAQNLGPLCRRHHVMKTHLPWELTADDLGEIVWCTPAGATVLDDPEPVADW